MDKGVRGLFGIQLRHITSTGQHLKALLKASEIKTYLTASYIIPGHNPITDQYAITSIINESRENFVGNSQNATLSIRYLTMLGKWKQSLALNALYDRSHPIDSTPNYNILLYPSASWTYVYSDDALRPTRGRRVSINLRGASQSALSSINFAQGIVNLKQIYTLQQNTRAIIQGSLGYTEVSDLDKLPLSLQFYVGGARSIRGYRYKSIGPGKQLLTLSLELQHRLYKHWYASLFYDVGNTRDFNVMGSLKQGVGVGLIWLSPLGAIELTVAKALNQPNKPLLIQFAMGPEL